MLTIQLISIELLIGIIAIGIISAWGKSVGERLCLLATIPVSFLIAFLLTKIGLWNFVGSIAENVVGNILLKTAEQGAYTDTLKLTGTMASSLVAHLMFSLLFWIWLIITRKLLRFILTKAKVREKYRIFSEKKSNKRKLGACTLGALHCLAVFMLSLLPVVALFSLPTTAVERGARSTHEGTYASEMVEFVNETYLTPLDRSILMNVCRYSGIESVLRATSDSIANKSIKTEDGNKVEVNCNQLVRTLLADGVTAVTMYEYLCDPAEHTVSDCGVMADVLHDFAGQEILMRVGVEVAQAMEVTAENNLLAQFLDIVKNSDTKELSVALDALGNAVTLLTEDGENATLELDALQGHLFRVLKSDQSASNLAQILASSDICCSVLYSATEYGLGFVCTAINISADRMEYYNHFIQDLYTALNDSETGKADLKAVEEFICYLIENNMAVAEFTPGEEDVLSEQDIGYYNYQRYIYQRNLIHGTFANYLLAKEDAELLFFSLSEIKVYAYDRESDQWHVVVVSDSISDGSALAVQFLIEKANLIHYAEQDTVMITAEMMADWGDKEYAGYAQRFATVLPDACYCDADALIKVLVSAQEFAPTTIYAEDIVTSVQNVSFKEALAQSGGVESFSKIIVTAATLMVDITGEDNTMTQRILGNFSDIGVMLDALADFGSTSHVPEHMIIALSNNKDYKVYFVSDAVEDMIQNANDGTSSYESLFTSIEMLYIIANNVVL